MTDDNNSNALPGLRVLAHPLRLQLLSLLSGTAMSAAEAARELKQTQANVSYHLRRLQAAGLLVPAEEVSVRGGKAKRYRHPADSAEHLQAGHPADHQQLAAAMASELVRRSHHYRPGSEAVFTDAQFFIQRGDWDEAKALARRLGELLHDSAMKAGGHEAVEAGQAVEAGETVESPATASESGGTGDDTATVARISATLFLFELLDMPVPDAGAASGFDR